MYRIKRSGRHLLPTTISTQQAVNTIKEAAEAKEDQSLYYEIKDLDLIAKEFKLTMMFVTENSQERKM